MERDQESCVEDSEIEELRRHPIMQEIIADLKRQRPERLDALDAMLAELEEDEGDEDET